MKDSKDQSSTSTKAPGKDDGESWQGELKASVSSLTAAGKAALARMIATKTGDGGGMAEKIGHALGMGAGVAVTEALRALPGANNPLLGSDGKPVQSVPGAERVGDHDILKRDQEVVGPKITALVKDVPPGKLHDFLEGFGAGATEAPGATYRFDSAISDAVDGKK